MNTHRLKRCTSICAFFAVVFGATGGQLAHSQTQPATHSTLEVTMPSTARGDFDVKLNQLATYNTSADANLGRMSIDKVFHGDLDATSQGEMLSAFTAAKEPAGYVAIERVTGTLQGRRGSFTLQHNATMTRGEPYLNIIVVPGSGTDELTGLTGTMKIIIAKGQHSYEFEYSLPGSN